MTTTVVKTIRASGGDYTTLSAWEAAQQGDLVSADQIRVAECYNDWPSGLSDNVTIAGSTTDATRYMMITVAGGHRHTGVPLTGFYLKKSLDWNGLLVVTDANFRGEYLDLWNTGGNGIAVSVGRARLTSCIGRGPYRGFFSIGSAALRNCLVYGSGIAYDFNDWQSPRVYNCVAAGSTTGFNCGSGGTDRILVNCAAYGNTTQYNGSWSTSSSNNASSAASGAPGSSAVHSITSAAFANAASNDYHLASGSALIGAGANLYATFTADIDGDAWPASGAWDIGFDYYVGASGTVNLAGNAAAQASASGSLPNAAALAGAAAAQAGAAGSLLINGVFAESPFTGAGPTELTAADSSWTKTVLLGAVDILVYANQIAGNFGNSALYLYNAAAPTADYLVAIELQASAANLGNSIVGVAGRCASSKFYGARYDGGRSRFELLKFDSVETSLGTYSAGYASGVMFTLGLRMVGDQIALLADGVAVITVTDSTFTAPGQAGVFAQTTAGQAWRGDNFAATLIETAGAINLAGSAGAQAAAAAALTHAVPIAGTGITLATSSGALSIGIPLTGATAAQAGASGALSTAGSADLVGAATATASASGGLSLSIPLSASAVANALASAGLSHGVPLAGSVTGQAGASGTMLLSVALAGNAIATAAAPATLTANSSSSMVGNAAANPSAFAALTHGVPLAGAALTVASGAGDVTHIVPIAGAAASASLATGGLDVRVDLHVAALAQALASAGLTVQGNAGLAGHASALADARAVLTLRINLDADAIAAAVAAGALAGTGQLVPTPGYRIYRADRTWRVSRPARNWRIAA